MSESQIVSNYTDWFQELDKDEQHLSRISRRLSVLRLIFFIAISALAILIYSVHPVASALSCIIGIFLFLYIVKLHHKKEKEKADVQFKKSLIKNELEVLEKLENSNYDGVDFIHPDHNFTSDLDVFGPFSIFALVNRARTFKGVRTLAQYMSETPEIEDIDRRRAAVQELTPQTKWRIEYFTSLHALPNDYKIDNADILKNILKSDLSFATKPALSAYRKALPFLWAFILILYFFYADIGYILAVIVGMANFYITMRHAAHVSMIQERLSQAGTHLDQYAHALRIISDKAWKSDIIKEKLSQAVSKNHQVEAILRLKKITDLLDYRLHMIPSFFLNVGLLWDSRVIAKLEHWDHTYSHLIEEIFDTIGLVEALASLATWSYHHPDHCYPIVSNDYFQFEGSNLQHPLLPNHSCVPNDFKIQKKEYVNIITGSNMSGKSTWLRTMGLNMILGYCGTKVKATNLSYGLVELITYMRIKDNLEENVSTFKSELNRVVRILDLLNSPRAAFVIADEMLRGTNSHDKLKGSKAIVAEIIKQKSYGLIATHDIDLAEMSDQYPEIANYYFDIDFVEDELVFDYRIKSGICKNFNASYLLKQLGLNITDI